MKKIAEVGDVIIFEHDGMEFSVFKSRLLIGTAECPSMIGCYVDNGGFLRSVHFKSLYGDHVVQALNQEVHHIY